MVYIDGLMQDSGISSARALKIPQSYTKPFTYKLKIEKIATQLWRDVFNTKIQKAWKHHV